MYQNLIHYEQSFLIHIPQINFFPFLTIYLGSPLNNCNRLNISEIQFSPSKILISFKHLSISTCVKSRFHLLTILLTG